MKKIIKLKDIKKFCAKDLFCVLYRDVLYFGIYSDDKKQIYLPTVNAIIPVEQITQIRSSIYGDLPKNICDSDNIIDENDCFIEIDECDLLNLQQINYIEDCVNGDRNEYQIIEMEKNKNQAENVKIISQTRKNYDFFKSNEKI